MVELDKMLHEDIKEQHMGDGRWNLTKEEQKAYMEALVEELAPLRARAGISQGELAYLVGVSRQTYSSIELKKKKMSWSTYLSLIMVFDSIAATHNVIRGLEAFPTDLIDRFNEGKTVLDRKEALMSDDFWSMVSELDDHAIHALKTTVLVEYARCKGVSGSEVVKSFDGIDFRNTFAEIDEGGADVDKAIRKIKEKYD